MRHNLLLALIFGTAVGFFVIITNLFGGDIGFEYNSDVGLGNVRQVVEGTSEETPGELEEVFIPTHVSVPDNVRGIYMTACVAATPSLREKLVELINETELNSIIIDIKDYTGTISFKSDNPALKGTNGPGCVVADMRDFINRLHEEGIYVIGRITAFQDVYYTNHYPELAVKRLDNKEAVWKDYKGVSFIEVGAKDFWDYIVAIAEESYNIGFDELNFDYIRFPSDGNMKNIYYPFSEELVISDPELGKAKILREFFEYLHGQLKDSGAILSADLFGMAATNVDDLNIGQILEYAEPYFDYLCPMVYPSHYPKGFNGYMNVNAHAYDIVKFSMDRASERMVNASTTPNKIRPWLQDFDYPVTYTTEMVRDQKQATYDAGLHSWMMWNASNKYTRAAYDSN